MEAHLAEGRDVARRARGDYARVDGLQQGGQRAAAGVAHAADAVLPDVRPGVEVVDGPHAVPDALLRGALPEERGERAVAVVRAAAEPPWRLLALALGYRVVHEDGKPRERALHAAALVGRAPLPVGGVSAREDDPVVRRLELGLVRQEQEPGDVDARAALEEDLLDSVSVARDLPRHLRVEGRALERQASDGLDVLPVHRGAVLVVLGPALQRAPGVVRRLVRGGKLAQDEVVREEPVGRGEDRLAEDLGEPGDLRLVGRGGESAQRGRHGGRRAKEGLVHCGVSPNVVD